MSKDFFNQNFDESAPVDIFWRAVKILMVFDKLLHIYEDEWLRRY